MNAINYTAHDVVFFEGGEEALRVSPSGFVARVINRRVPAGAIEVNGVVIQETRLVPERLALIRREDMLKKIADPEEFDFPRYGEKSESLYIVSAMVQDAMPGREDLYAPDTDAAIHDDAGRIIGVPGFIIK